MNRAVFLDRDGTINAMVYNPEFGLVDSPSNPEEFRLLPGIGEAIRALNATGFLTVVASNQPGVAKGKFTPAILDAITLKMHQLLAEEGAELSAVYYCLHHPQAELEDYRIECDCRKPKVGLLKLAETELGIDLAKSYFIGDGINDMHAGRAADTTTILLSSRKCHVFDEMARQGVRPDYMEGSLLDAAHIIQEVEHADHRGVKTADRPGPNPSGSRVPRAFQVDERFAMNPTARYVEEAIQILQQLDQDPIERMIDNLQQLRGRNGRLFFLGVGGGAGHASHAVNDFRKIAGIESYAPTDNVSELTARVNDDGWDTAYANWLRGSRLSSNDMVFVFSVGGGDVERNISVNLVNALRYAKEIGATVCGIVGRDGGFTAQVADACVLIPVVNPATVTPHTESFQALVWHLIVSHPRIQASSMKWESATLEEEGRSHDDLS